MAKPAAGTWMAAAVCGALILAGAALLVAGPGEHGIAIALRATGRWSFVWFWFAFTGGALATLFGPALQPLAARGRTFGLAYTAAQTVHVGLLVWLYSIAGRPPLPQSILIFFGVGIIWTYLLALLSFATTAQWFDPRVVRWLRSLGVYYIGFVFYKDLFRNPTKENWQDLALYLPFTGLIGLAVLLRVAAWARRLLSQQALLFGKRSKNL